MSFEIKPNEKLTACLNLKICLWDFKLYIWTS
jgi:hypothetical protein